MPTFRFGAVGAVLNTLALLVATVAAAVVAAAGPADCVTDARGVKWGSLGADVNVTAWSGAAVSTTLAIIGLLLIDRSARRGEPLGHKRLFSRFGWIALAVAGATVVLYLWKTFKACSLW